MRSNMSHSTKLMAAAAAALIGLAGSAFAEEQPAAESTTSDVLRVCAAANEAPYSVKDATGFENKVAELIAKEMGRKVEFVWLDKPAIYLVRDQLNVEACDVVMGLDTGDARVITTKPLYRAPYVFIQRKDTPNKVTSWDSPALKEVGNVGLVPGGPAEVMMQKKDLFSANFNYVKSLTNFKSPRNQYVRIDPSRMVSEVAGGKAGMAVAFAPEVARYVKANPELEMTIVPDDNVRVDGVKVPFHFDQSIGVRKEDTQLRDALDAAIDKSRPQIETVLKEEGIPVLPLTTTPGSKS
jgi:mxaJ protein